MSGSALPTGQGGGGATPDIPALRDLLGDKRVWVSQALVTGAAVVDEDDGLVDVPVELVPSGEKGHAQIVTNMMGAGHGDWMEPQENDLVCVILAQQHEGDQGAWFIIGGIWNKSMQKPSENASDGRMTVNRDGANWDMKLNGNVKLHVTLTGGAEMHVDGGTGAGGVTLISEHNDHLTIYNSHTHPVAGGGSTGPPSVTETPDTGTTKFKAE